MQDLNPCMADEMNQLTGISTGVGEIIQDFAIDELDPDSKLGNLNWKVENGDLPEGSNGTVYGRTYDYNSETNSVRTEFDSYNFRNATDLAIAQTILHEAVHAYLTAYFRKEPAIANKKFPELLEYFYETFDTEQAQHDYMSDHYIKPIAKSLQEFGNDRGIDANYQYYEDLAWGGLEQTKYFDELSSSDQARIKNRLSTELTGQDMSGDYRTPKGELSTCGE